MAGQRSYYGNYLTNVKGPVVINAKITCGGAATSYTVAAGKGVTVAHTGGSNDLIVTFPEKYGTCVSLQTSYIPAGAGDVSVTCWPTTDYSSATGKATFSTGARAATVNGATAVMNDPTGTVYLHAVFELGM